MQGIFQKENTDKALKYGIYRHLPTYEKIIRNLVSFYNTFMYLKDIIRGGSEELNWIDEQAVMEIDCMIGLNRHRLVYR